ncbi:hypothetical protein [Bacillus licheniformis]|uniref:hypothetical protein n=1 Tax=Bacillus licheniformis TaxID=1402 RepID=UPI002E22FAB7|nr:hypothetical protein [Bacillus licheniformis]
MDIKKTRRFETTDRAHADLFNIVIDQLNENDELLVKRAEEVGQKAKIYTDEHASRKDNPHRVTKEQLGLDQVDNIKQASKIEFDSHLNDNLRHIISQERDKWNNAQLFKITSDTGIHKYNLTSGTFYEALKDVGTGTFYGTNAVEDSPSNGSLRGMQLVGQKGIGIGYAIDTLGNAWWFYYNAAHTGIKWFPIESTVNAQLKADKMLNDAKNYTNNLELKLTDLTWLQRFKMAGEIILLEVRMIKRNMLSATPKILPEQYMLKVQFPGEVSGLVYQHLLSLKATGQEEIFNGRVWRPKWECREYRNITGYLLTRMEK